MTKYCYNYYKIPNKLAEGKEPTKAILYGLIESLCRNKGYCWASNSYLANKLGLKSPGNVSCYIKKLVIEGWIKTQVHGNQRKIWLIHVYPEKRIDTIQNNKSNPSKIPEDSIQNSKLTSNEQNLKRYNNTTKGLKDKMDMHKLH